MLQIFWQVLGNVQIYLRQIGMFKKIISMDDGLTLDFSETLEFLTIKDALKVLQQMERPTPAVPDTLVFTVTGKFSSKEFHKYNRIVVYKTDKDAQFLHGHLNGLPNPKIDLNDGIIYHHNKNIRKNWLGMATPKQLEAIRERIRQRNPELLEEGFVQGDNH